jgi:hypothetical protein
MSKQKKPRDFWIFKGTSRFADKLILNDDMTEMVKNKPEGFYDLVSKSDSIEGGTHVREVLSSEIIGDEIKEAKAEGFRAALDFWRCSDQFELTPDQFIDHGKNIGILK